MDFVQFKQTVATRFAAMSKGNLFRTNVPGDTLWQTYLSSFPKGTNPMFRERTEHDCSCCRSFIKQIGGVVTIKDGRLISMWGDLPIDGPYKAVADALDALITGASIDEPFYHYEQKVGTDKNFEQMVDRVQTWQHFFVNVPAKFIQPKHQIGTVISDLRGSHDVFLRSLETITNDAVDTVLELITQGSLYRGEENAHAVKLFKKLAKETEKLDTDDIDLFVWNTVMAGTTPVAVLRIRNTSIGKLLTDLSEGVDLETAVKAFESMVAPANYKRPTSLVTPKMVEQAKAKVQELGLLSALERRHAKASDISVNSVLFASAGSKKVMADGDPFAVLDHVTNAPPKDLSKVESVPYAKFVEDILPQAKGVEVLFKGDLLPNLMCLTAPLDPTAGKLFKWDNPISWSYNGEVADSYIRREVQARGGKVDGVFRFSHSWNHEKRNASLMDLHVFMPGNSTAPENGVHDSYGNRERVGWNNRKHHISGGVQDVDYVSEAPAGYIPVENITFPDLKRMPEGRYVCKIHNWKLRDPTQGGFRAEIEFGGQVFQYDYDRPLKHKEWVTVAEVTLKGGVFTIKHHLPADGINTEKWGIQTNAFHPVKMILKSPNYWEGDGVGNLHTFFIIDGCGNDQPTRGFYNEFLDTRLDPHRKVFEMLGSKLLVDPSPDQLAGLGFSSTQRNTVTVRVTGKTTRIFNVQF